jgi:hypothetical protein
MKGQRGFSSLLSSSPGPLWPHKAYSWHDEILPKEILLNAIFKTKTEVCPNFFW